MTDDERRRDDEPRQGEVQWHGWGWGDEQRRPGLPWIGIFLVVFGGLLLLERLVPQFRAAGSAFIVAIGIVFLVRWATERRMAFLYAGAIITALATPGVLQALGVPANEGLGTLCLGIAFLFIGLVRWQSGGGIGWQAWLGGILTVLGAVRIGVPQIGDLFLPALLIALGALLVFRGLDRS
jgi:hypothetical protein